MNICQYPLGISRGYGSRYSITSGWGYLTMLPWSNGVSNSLKYSSSEHAIWSSSDTLLGASSSLNCTSVTWKGFCFEIDCRPNLKWDVTLTAAHDDAPNSILEMISWM